MAHTCPQCGFKALPRSIAQHAKGDYQALVRWVAWRALDLINEERDEHRPHTPREALKWAVSDALVPFTAETAGLVLFNAREEHLLSAIGFAANYDVDRHFLAYVVLRVTAEEFLEDNVPSWNDHC